MVRADLGQAIALFHRYPGGLGMGGREDVEGLEGVERRLGMENTVGSEDF